MNIFIDGLAVLLVLFLILFLLEAIFKEILKLTRKGTPIFTIELMQDSKKDVRFIEVKQGFHPYKKQMFRFDWRSEDDLGYGVKITDEQFAKIVAWSNWEKQNLG